jgi:hypothetical protein
VNRRVKGMAKDAKPKAQWPMALGKERRVWRRTKPKQAAILMLLTGQRSNVKLEYRSTGVERYSWGRKHSGGLRSFFKMEGGRYDEGY